MALDYQIVDVFSERPFSGNTLPVFLNCEGLGAGQMLALTQELRCFEAVFLGRPDAHGRVSVRVFDLVEELPFAGHPLLGAAAVLHRLAGRTGRAGWRLELPARTVEAVCEADGDLVRATIDQGPPDFLGEVDVRAEVARAFSLEAADLDPRLPLEVASTGLRYLVVPVRPDMLEQARIAFDLTAMLARFGAQYAVLLDEAGLEIRHWTNDGVLEDVATGSAAGVIGAYRLKHGLAESGAAFQLRQGRFTGRPSVLEVRPVGTAAAISAVRVGGPVAFVGAGRIAAVPPT